MPVEARFHYTLQLLNFVGVSARVVQHGDGPMFQVMQPPLRRQKTVLAEFCPKRPVSAAVNHVHCKQTTI